MSNVSVATFCPLCHKCHEVVMTYEQLARLELGEEHVQDIFPEKTDAERELLISGTCSECWHNLFAQEDDDYPFGNEDEYIPSSTAGDYGPSNPWDAPGMNVSDFV